jgi:NitT/TauT family transport system permease protein
LIIESEARAEASGMVVTVIVLMLVGVALSAMIWPAGLSVALAAA